MTIEVKFVGFVNEVKQMSWGTVYNMSHSQRQKNEQDEWETVGYDYFDVVPAGPALDFQKGDRVAVEGRLKTRRFNGQDGNPRVALQVRATDMRLEQGQKRAAAAVQQVFGDVKPTSEPMTRDELSVWPEVAKADDIPF